ncbi:MAG: XdhC family protein [Candidatus Hydrogenedentes bacterium]|nr:XdhC family protein [Candidatus Hydrogenedentota bacterium]
MLDVYGKAVELIDSGRCFAMAVILDTDGSTPQETGVRAIIDDAGQTWGTLGGGIVEAEAQRHAVEACRAQRATVLDLELKHAYSREASAICGGRLRILIDPAPAKDRECYARASEARRHRKRGVLLTTVREGGQLQAAVHWFFENAISDAVGFPGAEEVRACLARETSQVFMAGPDESGTAVTALVEPVIPNPVLLIAGGGHIGQALARMASTLGFDVTVIDDRPEFTNLELFPLEAITRCGDIAREVAVFPIASDVYIVIVTRGHKQDAEALEACIHTPAAYIGMIGSRRKIAMIRENFIESGLATEAELGRIFAPIGLDIGAVTVPEIAASIAAELVAARRKGVAQLPRRVT